MRHYCPYFVDIVVLTPKVRGRREQNWVLVCLLIKSAPILAPFPIPTILGGGGVTIVRKKKKGKGSLFV